MLEVVESSLLREGVSFKYGKYSITLDKINNFVKGEHTDSMSSPSLLLHYDNKILLVMVDRRAGVQLCIILEIASGAGIKQKNGIDHSDGSLAVCFGIVTSPRVLSPWQQAKLNMGNLERLCY